MSTVMFGPLFLFNLPLQGPPLFRARDIISGFLFHWCPGKQRHRNINIFSVILNITTSVKHGQIEHHIKTHSIILDSQQHAPRKGTNSFQIHLFFQHLSKKKFPKSHFIIVLVYCLKVSVCSVWPIFPLHMKFPVIFHSKCPLSSSFLSINTQIPVKR